MIKRNTKIICTLGPSSSTESMISKMVVRGMNVARLNFSHGDHQQHQGLINLISLVNKKLKAEVGILQDLEGYRIRVGHLKKPVILQKDDKIYLTNEEKVDSPGVIPIDYDDSLKLIKRGLDVYIDDGKIHLKVLSNEGRKIQLKVIQGGVVKERKGINIPGMKLRPNILTEKDRKDLDFGILNKMEFIAQSFVRNSKDIAEICDRVRPYLPNARVIAKIENEEGIKNIDSIIDACDGIMIARGDLGVSLPIYKVPVLQKYIIRHCNRKKKVVINATQMLETMVEQGRPTRAEVSDVANAILDGTDYVMLSAETASGKYPSRSIQMMSQIIEYTEKSEEIRL